MAGGNRVGWDIFRQTRDDAIRAMRPSNTSTTFGGRSPPRTEGYLGVLRGMTPVLMDAWREGCLATASPTAHGEVSKNCERVMADGRLVGDVRAWLSRTHARPSTDCLSVCTDIRSFVARRSRALQFGQRDGV